MNKGPKIIKIEKGTRKDPLLGNITFCELLFDGFIAKHKMIIRLAHVFDFDNKKYCTEIVDSIIPKNPAQLLCYAPFPILTNRGWVRTIDLEIGDIFLQSENELITEKNEWTEE